MSIIIINKKVFSVFLFLAIGTNIGVSQNTNDSINIVRTKNDIAAKYIYKEQKLSFDSLYQFMKVNNDAAFKLMKQAKGSRVFARVSLKTGIAVILISLLNRMENNSNNSAWIGVGAGISALSIIGVVEMNKFKRRAVNLYNSNLTAQIKKPTGAILSFGVSPRGVGLNLRF